MSIPPKLPSPSFQGGDPSQVRRPQLSSSSPKSGPLSERRITLTSANSDTRTKAAGIGSALKRVQTSSPTSINGWKFSDASATSSDDEVEEVEEDEGEFSQARPSSRGRISSGGSEASSDSDTDYDYDELEEIGEYRNLDLDGPGIPFDIKKQINESPFDIEIQKEFRLIAGNPENQEALSKPGGLIQNLFLFCMEKNENKIKFFKNEVNKNENVELNKKEIKNLENLNRRLLVHYKLNRADAEINADQAHLRELKDRPKEHDENREESVLKKSLTEKSIVNLTQYKQKLIRDEVKECNKYLQKGERQLGQDYFENLQVARDALLLRLPSIENAHVFDGEPENSRINSFEDKLVTSRQELAEHKKELEALKTQIKHGPTRSPLELSATTPGKKHVLDKMDALKKKISKEETGRDYTINQLVSKYDDVLKELSKETRGLGKLPADFKAKTMRLKNARDQLLGKLTKPPLRIRMARMWADLFKSKL